MGENLMARPVSAPVNPVNCHRLPEPKVGRLGASGKLANDTARMRGSQTQRLKPTTRAVCPSEDPATGDLAMGGDEPGPWV